MINNKIWDQIKQNAPNAFKLLFPKTDAFIFNVYFDNITSFFDPLGIIIVINTCKDIDRPVQFKCHIWDGNGNKLYQSDLIFKIRPEAESEVTTIAFLILEKQLKEIL